MPRVSREGRLLAYREEGTGDPPVLFVHGWCCDHTYMAPLIEHYRRGHRTIAPDLSGHGQSDTSSHAYTMAGFADEVAWLCDHLGLRRPIVVGHSMGGATALELAVRHPGLPAAIVVLDTTVIVTPEHHAQMEALLPALRGPGYREAMREALAGFFSPWDDPARKERIVEAMTGAPQHVISGAWQAIVTWDGSAAAAACKVPALYVAASAPRCDLGRLKELCPQLLTAQVTGAGHFIQLEVPDQVNAMLDRFFELALA